MLTLPLIAAQLPEPRSQRAAGEVEETDTLIRCLTDTMCLCGQMDLHIHTWSTQIIRTGKPKPTLWLSTVAPPDAYLRFCTGRICWTNRLITDYWLIDVLKGVGFFKRKASQQTQTPLNKLIIWVFWGVFFIKERYVFKCVCQIVFNRTININRLLGYYYPIPGLPGICSRLAWTKTHYMLPIPMKLFQFQRERERDKHLLTCGFSHPPSHVHL